MKNIVLVHGGFVDGTIFLKAKCAASSETLDDEWQPDFWMLTA
jgi:hypothetical protein